MSPLTLQDANFPFDRPSVQSIFREYIQSTDTDLGFQNHEAEFANLPGDYRLPRGCVVLAKLEGCVVGCAAIRPINAHLCELKRVYLRPSVRGHQGGRQLVSAMMDRARARGYERMCLDVLPEFQTAQRLYESLGFTDAPPAAFNPVPGTRFMSLALT